jgi:hypothetical protein
MARCSVVGSILVVLAVVGCAPSSAGTIGATQLSGSSTASQPTRSVAVPADSAAARPVLAGEPWIVYQASGPEGIEIRLVRPDGTGDHLLSFGVPGSFKHPDWSPDGRRIAAAREDDNTIWLIDADGANPMQFDVCHATCDYPVWSPDGTSIAFSVIDSTAGVIGPSAGTILVADFAHSKIRTIVTLRRPQVVDQPRWSPDGTSLVVGIDVFDDQASETGSMVAIVPAVGGDWKALTSPDLFGYAADWSVTGLLVFSTETLAYRAGVQPLDDTWDLRTMRPDGTDVQLVTHVKEGVHLWEPSWTPDGSRIIATIDRPGQRTAVLVDPSTGAYQTIAPLSMTRPRLRPIP